VPGIVADRPGVDAPLVLGWQEWVALPALGLPAIRAKIDTGARTSALHAFDIEPAGPGLVSFKVHPVPRRPELTVTCTARLVDSRMITSSNGERERRIVVETELEIAGRRWPVEITLTNRALMRTRMLVGRQGVPVGTLIDPRRILLQPRLSYRAYQPRKAVKRKRRTPGG
jgi:ribosomal protein S6--L-glutamate ligase